MAKKAAESQTSKKRKTPPVKQIAGKNDGGKPATGPAKGKTKGTAGKTTPVKAKKPVKKAPSPAKLKKTAGKTATPPGGPKKAARKTTPPAKAKKPVEKAVPTARKTKKKPNEQDSQIGTEEDKKRWLELNDKHKGQKSLPYDMKKSFPAHSIIQHKVFGRGFIVSVYNNRLKVFFKGGSKVLISNYTDPYA